MCGICGIYGFSDKNLIKIMTDSMLHRGPDDEGYFLGDKICLGIKRLSIIDIQKGKQPMFNEEGDLCLIFNGEIYNFKELRKDLEEKGHIFSTECDTEVIVHSYEQYGKDCVNYFDGMFAFAIYDIKKNKLFLARDKLGIKPLYFFRSQKFFSFASEIKSLFKVDETPRKIDNESLLQFATFGHTLGNRTFFEDIWQLPAGSYCYISNECFEIKKYWEPKINTVNHDMEKEAEILEKNLINSVKMHLNANVPVGILLSGVDSGLIAAISSNLFSDINAITISDSEDNEDVIYSKIVSNSLGIKHQIEIIDTDANFYKVPETILHSEDMLDLAGFSLLGEKSKQKFKVVLCGEGADELFMGYRFYEDWKGWIQQRKDMSSYFGQNKYINSYLSSIIGLNIFQEKILADYLLNSHLMPMDKMFMQHGVEARVPYLSNFIISQSLSLTNELKIGVNGRKIILKKVALKYLPKEAVLRKKSALPNNLNLIYGKFFKICDKLISDDRFNNHPFKKLFRNKYNVLKYDLLNKIFIENNAEIPKNFSITDLY